MITYFNKIAETQEMVVTSVEKLKTDGKLGYSAYKNLLEATHSLFTSNDEEGYNLGLYSICHIGETPPEDHFLLQLLNDCIVASRIFLYKDMLPQSENLEESFIDSFTKSFYTLDTGTILTKDQKKLLRLFNEKKRLIVSAPTSFGKSRIIEEIIIHNNYSSIAIILPTIALLSETYLRFNNNRHIKENYNLINSLGLIDTINANSKNIFILTPEKMDMLMDERDDISVDFFCNG